MNSEKPDVGALAQSMVRAVDDFIAELKHLGVTITRNETWLLETIKEFGDDVEILVLGEHRAGTLLTVQVPTAELPRWRERLPDHIAAQFQCSRDDAVTFLVWRDQPGLIPGIQCNHPGCRKTRTCRPSQFLPSDVSTIIKRATSELWYCHVHAHKGLHQDGAVSDHVADILRRMQEAPGSNSTQLGITQLIGKFLESKNLATHCVTRSSSIRRAVRLRAGWRVMARPRPAVLGRCRLPEYPSAPA